MTHMLIGNNFQRQSIMEIVGRKAPQYAYNEGRRIESGVHH